MVSLLGLEGYSPDQIQQARDFSPALNRYLGMEVPLTDLHRQRHDAWIKCVLASYFQTSSTEEICAYWSQTADEILTRAWFECGLDKTGIVTSVTERFKLLNSFAAPLLKA